MGKLIALSSNARMQQEDTKTDLQTFCKVRLLAFIDL